ncbi:MAG: DNA-binding Lrp family transcriptional regulator [Saprospiraceae bacterium]|jgi:DNA-binding Lrp family transcriptional regulator
MMRALNPKDEALLEALRSNARLSISELARQLGVSRTTAQQRLQRLEKTGVITGYALRLGEPYLDNAIHAHVNLSVEPAHSADIISSLEDNPRIETLYTVSGKIDLIAIVTAPSASALDKTLDEIGLLKGIKSTDTAIILSTKIDRR